jgi:ribosomal protein S18 acetylase RimI-like enzyme
MIRKGNKQDLQWIMKMVSKTIHIMKEEMNDQWDETYPTLSIFEQDIRAESLFVLEEDGNVIGSITIDQNVPIEYKNESILWRYPGQAYTFHRLVVDPNSRGRGIASKLISNAEKMALQYQIRYIKIDTYSLNTKAQALFVREGFLKVGKMAFQGKELPFYCYDKIL